MLRNGFVFVLAFSVVLCNPQLISFKDGKIGVNFLGYHASAGLGGLLTGRAADGGLSASAGTPYGQNAAAGLGGSIDGSGRSGGGLYAGAQAAKGIEASAGLGGVISNDELAGTIFSRATRNGIESSIANGNGGNPETTNTQSNVVQKVKPPKKFIPSPQPVESRIGTNVESRDSTASAGTGGFQTTVTTNFAPSSTFFDSIFNIPIQTLRAVNAFLNNKASAQAGVSVQKSVNYGS